MKLQFSILWIDDDWSNATSKPNLERQKINISKSLENNYFLEDIKIENWSLDINTNFPYNSENFDLFIVDFNIWAKKWFEYIEWIRKHSQYTDIIFYSQNPIEIEIIKYLNDKNWSWQYKNSFLQWVFISKRDELATKFEELLDIIDRKVNNLYSMRGLVLAETADLDYILCEIINKIYDKNNINKNWYLYTKNYSVNPNIRDFTTRHSFYCFPFSHYCFTDWLKKTWSNELFCAMTANQSSPLYQYTSWDVIFLNKIQEYRDFYEQKRNKLSHWKTEIDTSGIMHAAWVRYTILDLKDMRKQILEFKECFENFRDSI